MIRRRLGILLHDFSLGGTERIALHLANEWARRGRDVTIFCGNPHGPLRRMVAFDVHLAFPRKPIVRGWRSRQCLGAWAAAGCRARHIEELFVPGNFHFASLPALRAGVGRSTTIVCKLSNPVRRPDRGAAARFATERKMARNLSKAIAVVAMSHALVEETLQTFSGFPINMIEEPILGFRSEAQHALTNARQGIVAAGRFTPQKDFALALGMVANVTDETARLTILGDGPLRDNIGKLGTRLGLGSRLEMPGIVQDVEARFRKSRVFLLSSRYEGFPAVAVEALAAGARIVATDCSPAIREIASNPERGEVVNSRSPVDLALAVDRQLRLSPVPEQEIASLHERYGLVRSAQNYLDLFDHL